MLNNNRLTQEQFLAKARAAHGDKYDYSQARYSGNSVKVTIICPQHGPFKQAPFGHWSGRNCPNCVGGVSIDTEEFIIKARQAHGNKYDYSRVLYTNNKAKATIICPVHGLFKQKASSHLRGYGCPSCGQKRLALGQAGFLAKAHAAHGDKYDYSQTDYTVSREKITVICPQHGAFKQKPFAHISSKHGCPACAREYTNATAGLDWVERVEGRIATLYFLKVFSEKEVFYKVGITLLSVAKRYRWAKSLPGYQYEILAQYTSINAAAVHGWEQSILETFSYLAYTPKQHFGGDTECFSSADEILAIFPL